MNGADIGWMILATGMVLLMTPALAFFYGGLVRSKNALNTMMMSFASLGVVGVLWAVARILAGLRAGERRHRRASTSLLPPRRGPRGRKARSRTFSS